MNTRTWLMLFLVVLAFPLYAQKQDKESLESLIQEALRENPEIAAEYSRAEMMRQRIPQAGALADPELTFTQMQFPGSNFGGAMSQNIEFMQMIMFPTKLSTQKDIASVAAQGAQWGYTAKTVDVIAQLRSAYAMLWDARERLSINRENQQLLEQILRTAQTMYSVGQVSQQDVLKTSIELARERTNEAILRQEVVTAENMLRAILHRPQSVPIGRVTLDSLSPFPGSVEMLVRYAHRHHPMLEQDSLNVLQGDLLVRMARQEYLPDFTISVERVFQPAPMGNTWTIMAGISLPFAPWSLAKASARVQEAQADRSMRQSMLAATAAMIDAGICESFAKVQAYESQVHSFENVILPQSQQSLQSSLAEYRAGHTPYLMLLDAFRMNQDMRMEASMARMKYEDAVAHLQQQVGVMDLKEIFGEEL